MVVVACWLCYANSLGGRFCYDDFSAIIRNPDVLPGTPLRNVWENDFWGEPLETNRSHKSFRPLTILSFRAHRLVGGVDAGTEEGAFGFHVINVFLHSLASCLFLRLCRTTGYLPPRWATTAALAFALHPVHVEAVANVVGRAELLAACFFLAGLICYLHAASLERNRVVASVFWVSSAVLCGFLALMSKEQGFTMYGVCIGWDLLFNAHVHMLVLPRSWALPLGRPTNGLGTLFLR